MTITLVVLEALLVVATGVEAWAREKRWPVRWLVWHLAPLWLVCVLACRLLQRRAEAVADWSVAHHDRRHPAVVVTEPAEESVPLVDNWI